LGSHQKYQQSKEDVYLLAVRAAEVVAIVANNCDPAKMTPEFKNNLDGLTRWEISSSRASQAVAGSDLFPSVLEEIKSWVESQAQRQSRMQKAMQFLKPDDACDCLRKKLENSIAQFGVCDLLEPCTSHWLLIVCLTLQLGSEILMQRDLGEIKRMLDDGKMSLQRARKKRMSQYCPLLPVI
jgi:hypothetical protein